jgi:hypothetical protein
LQEVQPTQMHKWLKSGGQWYPRALGLRCGHCAERSRFVIDNPNNKFAVGGAPPAIPCPNCDKAVRLYAVAKPRDQTARGWLFMDPHAVERERLDISGLHWPEPLAMAYEECVAALDAGLWTAAAGQARRTLEGVIKHLLGSNATGRMLGALLRDLPNHVPLDQPIKDAADALREGGNLASHFDLTSRPDAAVAKAMVQLLDDLIEYLFLLPENVAEVRRQLDAQAGGEAASP